MKRLFITLVVLASLLLVSGIVSATYIIVDIETEGTSDFQKSFEAGHVKFNERIINEGTLDMHENIYAFPVSTDDDGNPVPSTGVHEFKHIDATGQTNFYEYAEIGGLNWQRDCCRWYVDEPPRDVTTAYIKETILNNEEIHITKWLNSEGDWNLEEGKLADGKGDITIIKDVGFWTNTRNPEMNDMTEVVIIQNYDTDEIHFDDYGFFVSDDVINPVGFNWGWRPSPNFEYHSYSPDTEWFDYDEYVGINPLPK